MVTDLHPDTHVASLRAAGLRVTRPRLAVMAALDLAPHAQVEPVVTSVRAEIGRVSVQGVYDVLRVLGAAARYELRAGDNHHHAVCRSCGITADVDCAVGTAPCLDPGIDPGGLHGFVVDEAEVTYWGYCPSCRTDSKERQ